MSDAATRSSSWRDGYFRPGSAVVTTSSAMRSSAPGFAQVDLVGLVGVHAIDVSWVEQQQHAAPIVMHDNCDALGYQVA